MGKPKPGGSDWKSLGTLVSRIEYLVMGAIGEARDTAGTSTF